MGCHLPTPLEPRLLIECNVTSLHSSDPFMRVSLDACFIIFLGKEETAGERQDERKEYHTLPLVGGPVDYLAFLSDVLHRARCGGASLVAGKQRRGQ